MTPLENWTWGFLCGLLAGFGLTVAGLAWYIQDYKPDYSLEETDAMSKKLS